MLDQVGALARCNDMAKLADKPTIAQSRYIHQYCVTLDSLFPIPWHNLLPFQVICKAYQRNAFHSLQHKVHVILQMLVSIRLWYDLYVEFAFAGMSCCWYTLASTRRRSWTAVNFSLGALLDLLDSTCFPSCASLYLLFMLDIERPNILNDTRKVE